MIYSVVTESHTDRPESYANSARRPRQLSSAQTDEHRTDGLPSALRQAAHNRGHSIFLHTSNSRIGSTSHRAGVGGATVYHRSQAGGFSCRTQRQGPFCSSTTSRSMIPGYSAPLRHVYRGHGGAYSATIRPLEPHLAAAASTTCRLNGIVCGAGCSGLRLRFGQAGDDRL